jgi:hypothetical protein
MTVDCLKSFRQRSRLEIETIGDVAPSDDGRFEATGTWTSESAIDALEPDHH